MLLVSFVEVRNSSNQEGASDHYVGCPVVSLVVWLVRLLILLWFTSILIVFSWSEVQFLFRHVLSFKLLNHFQVSEKFFILLKLVNLAAKHFIFFVLTLFVSLKLFLSLDFSQINRRKLGSFLGLDLLLGFLQSIV